MLRFHAFSCLSSLSVALGVSLLGCGDDAPGEPDAQACEPVLRTEIVHQSALELSSGVLAARDGHVGVDGDNQQCLDGEDGVATLFSMAVTQRDQQAAQEGDHGPFSESLTECSDGDTVEHQNYGFVAMASDLLAPTRGDSDFLSNCWVQYVTTPVRQMDGSVEVYAAAVIDTDLAPSPQCPVATAQFVANTMAVPVSSGDAVVLSDNVAEPARIAAAGGRAVVVWVEDTGAGPHLRLAGFEFRLAPEQPLLVPFAESLTGVLDRDEAFSVIGVPGGALIALERESGQPGSYDLVVVHADLDTATLSPATVIAQQEYRSRPALRRLDSGVSGEALLHYRTQDAHMVATVDASGQLMDAPSALLGADLTGVPMAAPVALSDGFVLPTDGLDGVTLTWHTDERTLSSEPLFPGSIFQPILAPVAGDTVALVRNVDVQAGSLELLHVRLTESCADAL